METAIIVAIIAATASILGAALSYLFAKRKEHEADWRKVKFEHYREFMTALAGIVGSDATPDGHRRFAQACNITHLVASKQVIEALHAFRDEIAMSNPNPSLDEHDALLSALVRAIRADLGVSVTSNPPELSVRLWVSGVNSTPATSERSTPSA